MLRGYIYDTLRNVNGETAKVLKVTGSGPLKLDYGYGITKGTEIYVRKVAP